MPADPEPGDQAQMRRCITAVRDRVDKSTYPIGAALALGETVLSLRCSRLPFAPDPSAHPEMDAVRAAAEAAGSRYLPGAVLYSTLEPCPMCTSVAVWAKLAGIVYGASQLEVAAYAPSDASSPLTWRQIAIRAEDVARAGTPRLWVRGGVLREECLALLGPPASPKGTADQGRAGSTSG